MKRWLLVPAEGAPLALPDHPVVVGRAASCEIRLEADTISRQHAVLSADPDGLLVRDLGSSNGVRVNGVTIARARLALDDVVSFGDLAFRVSQGAVEAAPLEPGPAAETALPPQTVLRTVDVPSGSAALARLHAERLSRLVELAGQLSGAFALEPLLATAVRQTALLLPVDRVALLVRDGEGGALRLAHWHNGVGAGAVHPPASILQRALAELRPVTTESAVDDARFQSGSVVRQQVRAALCIPLLADQEAVVGALYVDRLLRSEPFSDDEAALCFAFGGLVAVSIAKAHFAEAARRDAVARANFERFFAPAVAAGIAAAEGGARPGGVRRSVAVLYSDVRSFTGLAESLPPETVAEQLSEYLAAMVEVVFEHGGTLDKFIGDALLAVWGAPHPSEDAADRALAAARRMQVELTGLNSRWSGTARAALGVGIGLHFGEAFTGMIGSPRRLEYTIIGDVVNVAARLCDAAREGEIVLSQAFADRLQEPVTGAAEQLALRGREAGVAALRIPTEGGTV